MTRSSLVRRVTAALLLLPLAACGRDLAVPAPVTGSGVVSGRLLIEQAGSGVRVAAAGATVQRLPDGPTAVATDEGYFSLQPGALPYSLLFAYDGDGDGRAERQRVLRSADLGALEGADVAAGEVLLGENGSISGRLQFPEGVSRDLLGIAVFVADTPLITFTTPDGSFLIDDVPAGVVLIGAATSGWALPDHLGVEVEPGEARTVAALTLAAADPDAPPGHIIGEVRRATGDGLADAVVELIPLTLDCLSELEASAGTPPLCVSSIPTNGPFDHNVLPGLYALRVTYEGYGAGGRERVLLTGSETIDLGTIVVAENGEAPALPRLESSVAPPEPPTGSVFVARWEPSPLVPLSPLGPFTAVISGPLAPDAVLDDDALVLVSEEGEEIPLRVTSEPSLEGAPLRLQARPRKPLPPGRYVASLSPALRDAENAPVQPSPRTFEVRTLQIHPLLGESLPTTAVKGDLQPSVLPGAGVGSLLAYTFEVPPQDPAAEPPLPPTYQVQSCLLDGFGDLACAQRHAAFGASNVDPTPRLFGSGEDPFVVFRGAACEPLGTGYQFLATSLQPALQGQPIFAGFNGNAACIEHVGAPATSRDNRFVTVGGGGDAPLELFELAFDVAQQSVTGTSLGARPWTADAEDVHLLGDGEQTWVWSNVVVDNTAELRLERFFAAEVELQPETPARDVSGATVCLLGDAPIAIWSGGELAPGGGSGGAGSLHAARLRASDRAGVSRLEWEAVPSLDGAGTVGARGCATVGDVVFVAVTGASNRIFLYQLDDTGFVQVLDPASIDGAIASPGVCRGDRPELRATADGILLTFDERCRTGQGTERQQVPVFLLR